MVFRMSWSLREGNRIHRALWDRGQEKCMNGTPYANNGDWVVIIEYLGLITIVYLRIRYT